MREEKQSVESAKNNARHIGGEVMRCEWAVSVFGLAGDSSASRDTTRPAVAAGRRTARPGSPDRLLALLSVARPLLFPQSPLSSVRLSILYDCARCAARAPRSHPHSLSSSPTAATLTLSFVSVRLPACALIVTRNRNQVAAEPVFLVQGLATAPFSSSPFFFLLSLLLLVVLLILGHHAGFARVPTEDDSERRSSRRFALRVLHAPFPDTFAACCRSLPPECSRNTHMESSAR